MPSLQLMIEEEGEHILITISNNYSQMKTFVLLASGPAFSIY